MDDLAVKEFSTALAGRDAAVTDDDTQAAQGHDYWGFGGTPGLPRPCADGNVT
jgi:glycolate oxidase